MRVRDIDAAELPQAAEDFRERLNRTKQRIGSPENGWYPYDTFGVFVCVSRLLGGQSLAHLAADYPVLDIGTGDGDLAFFLESLGYQVHAIDYPGTNANSMRGVTQLKAALRSSVEVYAVDLEGPFELPAPRYSLAFFLGVLYHLQNPYHVLQTLAGKVRHMVLSTRVAELGPDRRTGLRHLPVAYLVGDRELNDDCTNYWIFSEEGLKRILSRTGWDLLNFFTVGCATGSDPVSREGDQRAYCLLRSRVQDPGWSLALIRGWHEVEEESWRWTARRFSLRVNLTHAARLRRLEFDFTIPGVQFANLGAIGLGARVNGVPLGAQVFATPGEHTYTAPAPDDASASQTLDIEFELDKSYGPTAVDSRELGVLVVFERRGTPLKETHSPLRLVFG